MDKYEIVRRIEAFAPLETQEKWDCSGWVVDRCKDVKMQRCKVNNSNSSMPLNIFNNINKVLFALTVTDDVVRQAREQNCDMIISHHPLFYVPLEYRDINIYCAHTNLDLAKGGTTDRLIEKLGFVSPSLSTDHLSTCVAPPTRDAGCSIQSSDLSTCVAPPTRGEGSENAEVDLESQNNLVTPSLSTDPIHLPLDGFVRIVELEAPITVEELRDRLLKISPNLRYVNNYGAKTVKTIGFCAGSGSEFIGQTDAFVTGDLKFHTALEAKKVVFDIGHFESEIFAPELLMEISGVENGVIADEKSPFI